MMEPWVEKWRPKKISECVLTDDIRKTCEKWVEDKFVPNVIFHGTPGIGKTSVARALLDEIDADYMVINGSLHGNIDTLRNNIMNFASTVSFTGSRKYVILDEADYLNANSTQPALRNFMEEYSKNCGFILTCNYVKKIIEPLHSRCSMVSFAMEGKEKKRAAMAFYKRLMYILDAEGVEYDPAVLPELIMRYFPDWRKVLNECQKYSSIGKIDTGILSSFTDQKFRDLVEMLRAKKFGDARRWVGENSDVDFTVLARKLYDEAYEVMRPEFIPQAVIILARYQYQAAFVADAEINTMACLTELMHDVGWK